MTQTHKAPIWAKAISIGIALAGACVLLIVCQALYAALVLRMRVLFPFLLSPLIAVVGIWWMLVPWFIIRRYGRGAMINLVAGALTVGVALGTVLIPLLCAAFS
jgi:hypothetical protein